MTTDIQIAANRANASRSTGPNTPEGKEKSSQNARKKRLPGETPLTLDENLALFASHCEAVATAFEPQDAFEEELVRQIALDLWRLGRVQRIEAALFDAEAHRADHVRMRRGDPSDLYSRHIKPIDIWPENIDAVSRREAAIKRGHLPCSSATKPSAPRRARRKIPKTKPIQSTKTTNQAPKTKPKRTQSHQTDAAPPRPPPAKAGAHRKIILSATEPAFADASPAPAKAGAHRKIIFRAMESATAMGPGLRRDREIDLICLLSDLRQTALRGLGPRIPEFAGGVYRFMPRPRVPAPAKAGAHCKIIFRVTESATAMGPGLRRDRAIDLFRAVWVQTASAYSSFPRTRESIGRASASHQTLRPRRRAAMDPPPSPG